MTSQLQLPSKEEGARDFKLWLAQLPAKDIIIFSDGSQAEDGAVGWGLAIFTGSALHSTGCGRLGLAEVFDAEISGALAGLQTTVQFFPPNISQKYYVCIDSTSAINSLRDSQSDMSQAEALSFQQLARQANAAIRCAQGIWASLGTS